MGEINIFDLTPYVEKHGCKTYFETGTGKGVCLSHALNFDFEKFYSVDLDEELVSAAKNRFVGYPLTLINDYSSKALEQYVPTLTQDPVFFFLDAHFPGADFHKMSYEESIRTYKEEAFPLHLELQSIKKSRNTDKDVFLIDDFKLYEEGDYEFGGWAYSGLQEELGLVTKSQFIYDLFKDTHTFEKSLRHQGFLFIIPKI
jgi:hypothetical protein